MGSTRASIACRPHTMLIRNRRSINEAANRLVEGRTAEEKGDRTKEQGDRKQGCRKGRPYISRCRGRACPFPLYPLAAHAYSYRWRTYPLERHETAHDPPAALLDY